MVPVRQNLCPSSRYSIKCPYTRTPSRIVVHNTANDATAANEVAYMIRNNNEVSFHYAVDDKEAVQGLPLNRNAWASGDGHGKGNMEGIHIEICYSLSGGPRFIKAEQNAAEFIASLLKQYGWGIDKVTKHQDYDGKYCPHRTLDMGWQRFLNMIQSYLSKEEVDMTKEEVTKLIQDTVTKAVAAAVPVAVKQALATANAEAAKQDPSKWAQPAIAYVCEHGLMANTGTEEQPKIDRPQSPLTRQEAAQMSMNLHKALTTTEE